MGFQLRNCANTQDTFTTNTNLSQYIGNVLELEGYVGTCWTVVGAIEGTGPTVTVAECYKKCEDCLRTAYLLTDCSGRLQPIYSSQEDLEDHVGNVIKVPYYDMACFTVSIVKYDRTKTYYEIDYSNTYTSCELCKRRKTIDPEYTSERCDTEYIEKVKYHYSELHYQKVISKRYGVAFCCPQDEVKWEIKNEILDNQLIDYPSPDLPEAYVESCCIEISSSSRNCNSTDCTTCNQELPKADCPCNCSASSNTIHDCHTYVFTVTAEMLLEATGNTNTAANGKVYFGYIPCGGNKSLTKSYNTASQELKTFCVLGIPILGWFKNNEWVEHTTLVGVTLTRGAVCEEDINECDTCN